MTAPTRAQLLRMLGAVPVAASLPRIAAAQTGPVIRFATSPTAESYLLPVYALESGIFTRHGLNVSIVSLPNAGAISAALIGGAVDVAVLDPILIANGVSHGVPLAFFAGGGMYRSDASTSALCVANDSPLRAPKDFEGKTIGVISLSSISTLGVKAWLAAGGANIDSVRFFEIPFALMVPAINRGTLNAAFVSEPFLSELKSSMRVAANAFDAIGKAFLINGCYTQRGWIAQNGATTKRLTEALDETVRWANAHHDDTAPITAKYASLSVETVHKMTRLQFGMLDAKLLQPVLDVAVRFKSIDKHVDAADIIVSA
jgi:NitT/TauT family transport system substrate-binding protein